MRLPATVRRLLADRDSAAARAALRRAHENQRLARLAILAGKIAEADRHAADGLAAVHVPPEVVDDVCARLGIGSTDQNHA